MIIVIYHCGILNAKEKRFKLSKTGKHMMCSAASPEMKTSLGLS